jgi:II/X family phage/plasmid replication protein
MIDWLDVEFPYSGTDLNGGYSLDIDEHGAIKFERSLWKWVEGSYSSKIRIKAEEGYCRISGNPEKFLTGQNLFTHMDKDNHVPRITFKFIRKVFKSLNLTLPDLLPIYSAIKLNRVDINQMYKVGTNDDVNQWLKLARQYATGRQQLTTGKGSTVYIGQHSRRKAWKFYNKFEELQKHPPYAAGDKFQYLMNYSNGCVRAELVLRGQYLSSKQVEGVKPVSRRKKRNGNYFKIDEETTLRFLKNWSSGMADIIYMDEIRKTNLPSESKNLCSSTIEEKVIPSTYRGTYILWSKGVNVRDVLSKPTFYRHKSYFQREHGIDLASHSEGKESLSIPLLDLLVGRHTEPLSDDKEWFFATG